MFGTLLKKKLDADRLANVFVNSLLQATQDSFPDVSEMINEDAAFVKRPEIGDEKADHFILIVLSGNLNFLSQRFEPAELAELRSLIIQKLAVVYDMETRELEEIIVHYEKFISRVNHPSKNTLYGMSKALFHKLELNEYQESYFKSMKTPNPLFLKRMDDIMSNFIWDWDEFFRKYKMSLN